MTSVTDETKKVETEPDVKFSIKNLKIYTFANMNTQSASNVSYENPMKYTSKKWSRK